MNATTPRVRMDDRHGPPRRRENGALVALALLIGMLAVGGCTTLVGKVDDVLKCEEINGVDPCPLEDGLECVSGICQPIEPEPQKCETVPWGADPCRVHGEGLYCSLRGYCEPCLEQPGEEKCNGVDDDCDGEVDEGFDEDSDGFTFCGGGREELVDCAREDPAVHPAYLAAGIAAAAEICDGKDNDCNGKHDDNLDCTEECNPLEPFTCECDPAVPTVCEPAGLKCDPETERCVVPQSLGSKCNNDSGCVGDGICIDSTPLELTGWENSDKKICARACCTDADCEPDNVCLVPGTGVRVCLPATYAGLETRGAGESCYENQQCSSRICDQEKETCQTACATSKDCGDRYCIFNPNFTYLSLGANPGQFVCGEQQGRGQPGSGCNPYLPDCTSGLCTAWMCTIPCGSHGDCTDVDERWRCGYYEMHSIEMQGVIPVGQATRVSYCYYPALPGDVTDVVCCKDEHCGEGNRCRPDKRGDAWGMYCVPDVL